MTDAAFHQSEIERERERERRGKSWRSFASRSGVMCGTRVNKPRDRDRVEGRHEQCPWSPAARVARERKSRGLQCQWAVNTKWQRGKLLQLAFFLLLFFFCVSFWVGTCLRVNGATLVCVHRQSTTFAIWLSSSQANITGIIKWKIVLILRAFFLLSSSQVLVLCQCFNGYKWLCITEEHFFFFLSFVFLLHPLLV